MESSTPARARLSTRPDPLTGTTELRLDTLG
jgi:hypothetical protein